MLNMYTRMTHSGLGCRCLTHRYDIGAYLGTSAGLGEINLASYTPVLSQQHVEKQGSKVVGHTD